MLVIFYGATLFLIILCKKKVWIKDAGQWSSVGISFTNAFKEKHYYGNKKFVKINCIVCVYCMMQHSSIVNGAKKMNEDKIQNK